MLLSTTQTRPSSSSGPTQSEILRCRNQARERVRHMSGLRPTERVVLDHITNHVHWSTVEGWGASVSQLRLTGETELSRSTIGRTTKALARRGYIRKLPPWRKGDVCRYVIFAKQAPPAPTDPVLKKTHTGRGKMTHHQENSVSPVSNSRSEIPIPVPIPQLQTQKPENGSGDAHAREVSIPKIPNGELGNVRLTESQRERLQVKLGETIAASYIQTLDYHIAATRRVYVDHYAKVMLWFTQDQRKNSTNGGGSHVQRSRFESTAERKARRNREIVAEVSARMGI